eukprot:10145383-Ditylum_brightwellii.AAC.1
MLGHLKAPGGGTVSQKNSLQRKLESCYIKSVGYVLGQCFFTQAKLEEIETDAIRVFKSRMGYNKNMTK